MGRETKKRSNQASRHTSYGRSLLPGWVWGLSGLSVGLFVALLVHLQQPAPNSTAAVASLFQSHGSDTGDTAGQSTDNTLTPNDELAQPRFEFYKLLPDQKVEVSAPEPYIEPLTAKRPTASSWANAEHPHPQPQAIKTTSQNANAKEANAGYLLQAGSFRNLNDADQLKANLALLGIEASIQNVELARGETWHRVRIGPFSDRQQLGEIRKRLQVNNIHAIVLKHGG